MALQFLESSAADINIELRAAIRMAEETTAVGPTDAQKESGNYRKGRFQLHGMPIVVENPKGSTRTGTGKDGQTWSVTMPATYGYIARTEGADGDQVDVYIGPEPETGAAYIIDQVNADTGLFDEHKVMLGYVSTEAALADYDAAFSDGRGPERRGAVTPMSIDAFRGWVGGGYTNKPVGILTKAVDGTRTLSPEGIMRAGAVLTRAGPIEYNRSELGLDGDGSITIHRTIESLRHPETLDSLRGAPITVGHPEGGVTPDNFQDVVVGSVAGEPTFLSNTIVGAVSVGARGALKRLDEGVDELSIGYDFHLGPEGSTVGPIRVNHVAIVERGRAGSSVRVLDSLEGKDMPEMMSKKDMEDAFSTALDGFMKKMDASGKTGDKGFMREDISTAISDAMKPMFDGFKKFQDTADKLTTAEDERKSASDLAAAEAKAATDLKTLTDTIEADAKARYDIMMDAMPLIPNDKRAGLDTSDAKAVLVAAVGDSVPNAAAESIDYLRGVAAVMRKAQDDGAGMRSALPDGVVPFDSARHSVTDARKDATAAFIKSQTDAYAKSGGK